MHVNEGNIHEEIILMYGGEIVSHTIENNIEHRGELLRKNKKK